MLIYKDLKSISQLTQTCIYDCNVVHGHGHIMSSILEQERKTKKCSEVNWPLTKYYLKFQTTYSRVPNKRPDCLLDNVKKSW